jgi:TatA/E family protein of Tat protein translocase
MSPSIWQILIVVGIFAVLFMSPKRIPNLFKSLGEGIRDFKKGLDGQEIDVTDSVKREQVRDGEVSKETPKARQPNKENA